MSKRYAATAPMSPRRSTSPPKSARGQRAVAPPPRISPELENLKQKALNGEDISKEDASLFPQLIVALKQQRDFLISFDLFDDSEQCDKTLREVIALNEAHMKSATQKSYQSEIRTRLQAAKKEYNEIEKAANRTEKKVEESLQNQLKSIRQRQEKEFEEFNQEWDSEKKLRHYNRTSAQLRSLRQQAVLLLNSHRYEEMRRADSTANALEAEEAEKNHYAMEKDYAVGLEMLKNKHAEEIDKIERVLNVRRAEFQAAKEFDLSVARQKIKNLENQLESASDMNRVWNRKSRSLYFKSNQIPVATTPLGSGKKAINVSEFNTLPLPQLGALSESARRKKEKFRGKLKERISAPVSPRYSQSPRPQTTRGGWGPYDSPSSPLSDVNSTPKPIQYSKTSPMRSAKYSPRYSGPSTPRSPRYSGLPFVS